MNAFRKALLPLALLPALTAVQAEAVAPPDACTQAVDSLARSPAQHRVNQFAAPKPGNGKSQTYWINSRSGEQQPQQLYKSKCVTGADGEIVSLRVEQGYWK